MIEPALARGAIVIADRFADSTLAYQGYGSGLPLDALRAIITFATAGRTPDLTLLLDLAADQGLARKSGSGRTRFEEGFDAAFHARVASNVLATVLREMEIRPVAEAAEQARLAQLIHSCLSDLGVSGVVQFIFDQDVRLFPPHISASYLRLLNFASESNARIVSQGRFLLFSFEHLQLLVTDAPVHEEERYGRLRDVLAHLVSIAEARAKTLKVNSLLKTQQDNTRTVMMLLEMSSRDNRNAVKEIMTELSDSLRMIATGFDLNMQQESALLGLSEKALESLESLQEATSVVEEYFRSLVQELEAVSLLLDKQEQVAQDQPEQDSRVELF